MVWYYENVVGTMVPAAGSDDLPAVLERLHWRVNITHTKIQRADDPQRRN